MLTPLQRINTKDAVGNPNGYVVPIWRADSGERVSQVYLTVVEPGAVKGPHLHKVRCGRFVCVHGVADIITRDFGRRPNQNEYVLNHLVASDPMILTVPPGVAAEIRCAGDEPAYLLNLPDPAWSAEDTDEWPVENWEPPA